jgi:hypothetical protein
MYKIYVKVGKGRKYKRALEKRLAFNEKILRFTIVLDDNMV